MTIKQAKRKDIMPESARSSKLLSLFNKLDEQDKDIVIALSESLVTKHKSNMTESINNTVEKIGDKGHHNNYQFRACATSVYLNTMGASQEYISVKE